MTGFPSPVFPETRRWGGLLALGAAGISGISIFVNSFAVKQVPDPTLFTTLKNGVALALLVAGLATVARPADLRSVPRGTWFRVIAIGLLGGGVAFLAFFNGLAMASAPSAAFIHKTLFVWVALLALPLLGERLGRLQLGALGVLLAGQILILRPSGIAWGTGETLIALATVLWACETILARRVLATVPSGVLAVARLGIGLFVLIAWVIANGKAGLVAELGVGAWSWVLLTGGLLGAYAATWFAALRRAPASEVTAILVVGAPVTALLQALQAGVAPAPPVLAGQLLVLVGGLGLASLATRPGLIPARVGA